MSEKTEIAYNVLDMMTKLVSEGKVELVRSLYPTSASKTNLMTIEFNVLDMSAREFTSADWTIEPVEEEL